MPRSTIIFILFLSVLATLLGYNYFAHPFANLETETFVQEELSPDVESTMVLSDQLEVRQQLTQLMAFPYSTTVSQSSQSATLNWIKQNQPGTVVLFGEKISTTSAQSAVDKIKASFPDDNLPLVAVDHEGGTVQRLSGAGFTRLPSWKSLCEDSSSTRQNLLSSSAQELSILGINVVFAPVVDVASQSAILRNRVCSADPVAVKDGATEFIEFFTQQQILPVIKHYPGIGSIKKDLHRDFEEVTLTKDDISVFEKLLTSYSSLGVMSAHVGVKDRYEDMPCSLNEDCLDDLDDFFPNALVFSDALDMDSAGYVAQSEELSSLEERALAALKAGNDVLVFGPNVKPEEFDKILQTLEKAFESDSEFKRQVEKSFTKFQIYKIYLQS